MEWFGFLIEALVKSVIIAVTLLTGFAYMTYAERRVVALMQVRKGPNRVGPAGLLQPLADGIKLFFKETPTPRGADRVVYTIAPIISTVAALLAFAVVPIGESITLFGYTIPLRLTDLNIGLLYILGITSLGVYGIVLAGWSSNNKYALIGGLRSSAQMISYELSLGLSLVATMMLVGSLSLLDIVYYQQQPLLGPIPGTSIFLPRWFLFVAPLGFVVWLVSAIAETNRAPFDLPEAETELVAGYHTEYAGMRFALFFMAEYINMINVGAFAATLFLGGWQGPFLSEVLGPVWFTLKVMAMLFLYIWLRATLPRFRYDRLMTFGWKVLLPLSLVNVFIYAAFVAFWR